MSDKKGGFCWTFGLLPPVCRRFSTIENFSKKRLRLTLRQALG
ncbi:MAG TPA: hypothetical protein VGC89_20685 [Pyrinomonadaceae bacterium]